MKKLYNKVKTAIYKTFFTSLEGKLASMFLGFGALVTFIQPISGLVILLMGLVFTGVSIYDNVKEQKQAQKKQQSVILVEDYQISNEKQSETVNIQTQQNTNTKTSYNEMEK